MARILVGIDGSKRGERALAWALYEAPTTPDPSVTLLTVVSEEYAKSAGVDEATVEQNAEGFLAELKRKVAAQHPAIACETRVEKGEIVSVLADVATDYDLVVLGTHHGSKIGETISGAKGLRVSISTTVPTVVVPVTWSEGEVGAGIVVGVAQDDSSDSAIEYGAQLALAKGAQLNLVSAYGVPPFLSRPAEVMGGGMHAVGEGFQTRLEKIVELLREQHEGLVVSGVTIEGASPTQVLNEYADGCEVLILGTHSRSALGRAIFGSVSHSVLMNLTVPTIIVPQP